MSQHHREQPITSANGRSDLRSRRKALGLTLKQVAALSGLHLSAVCKLERGSRRPRPATLIKYEIALAVAASC